MTEVQVAYGRAAAWVARALEAARAWLGQAVRGQGLVEYALVLVLIAVTVIGAIALFGDRVDELYSDINCGVVEASERSRPPGCP